MKTLLFTLSPGIGGRGVHSVPSAAWLSVYAPAGEVVTVPFKSPPSQTSGAAASARFSSVMVGSESARNSLNVRVW